MRVNQSAIICRTCHDSYQSYRDRERVLYGSCTRSFSLSLISLGSLGLWSDLNAVHESTFLLPSRNCCDFPYLSYYSYSCHACWSHRSLLPSLSLSRSPFVLSGHLEIVTSYGCDRRLSIRIVCRQSSIHLISFFRNNKKRSRYFQIVFSWRR